MKKAMISSTARDMPEHRRMVVDACQRVGFHPIMMEHLPAQDRSANDVSIGMVEEVDVYLGIFAHAYGSSPDNDTRSYTEIEFDKAVNVGIPVIAFFADENTPWPPRLVDKGEKAEKLEHLKQKVARNRIVQWFKSPEDLRGLVIHALGEFDKPQAKTDAKPGLAPPMPSLIVGREEALHELKTRLGVGAAKQEGVPVQILTAVRGWPGIGKTTLATALANDPDITKAFRDGHLWASLGTKPDLFSELDGWARAFGVTDLLQEKTLEKASRRMAAILRNRRLLLIIDDVWEVPHARALMVGGAGCATLITTRNTGVANALATPEHIYVLERLSDDASLELLARLAPHAVQDYRKECLNLAEELEGLPLALQVAGRMLHAEASRGWNVRDLLRELRSGAALLEREAPPDMADLVNQTTPTIVALLKKSTDLLDAKTRERFALLGVVKEKPAAFDLMFMRAQWLIDDPKPTADTLVDRGLLEPIGNQRFTMHALLVALGRSLLEKT